MSLDKRKVKILKAIISSYIDNAEAVGSRTISKKYELGVSPATIRNEMSDLEEMGFLMQPHTSSGRIPTDKAYRYYVDDLWKMVKASSNNTNLDELRKIIEEEANELDSVFKNSVRILSQFTKYTSFLVSPQLRKSTIKRIQLVPVTETKVLLLLILESNIIKQVMLKLKSPIPIDQIDKISNTLSEQLFGYKLEDVNSDLKESLIKYLYSLRDNFGESLLDVLPFLINQVEKLEDISVYSDGISNILNLPEYNDLDKAREFITFAENKHSVAKLFQSVGENDLAICIGQENLYEELRDCSLITATYKFNGRIIGKIGVVGPTRMDYQRVISTVKSISEVINGIIDQNLTDDNKE
ncbi:heat-inducible transcriptional repressor HrcA [Sedimentibacter sp. MB31-C6]|uniref:heat-inducible transcriptional repressor HrcA n=1 Tax=Sedimentibacter sp. MB31-C6 TaxID=3109366 RepID=UPI002DDD66ED|nr:heat-inducible transcriptional repressor HrcA [Sedimentibacter sp. MB36-C1]WSI03798.1 heat-inducible transcriptional repressor HrcA [Sedimentibacter sp. MB36-C1]